MDSRKNKIMPTHNKKITKDSRGYGLKQIAKMTLGSGNIDLAVELPKGEDLNEWLAVNTIEFYNDINLLHPFREGNGRAQRVLITQIAKRAGYDIDFTLVDRDRMMIATIYAAQGVLDQLKELFLWLFEQL